MLSSTPQATLTDNFGRKINYLRLSVTDRCDFRCIYCMAEDMTFLPRQQVLSLEELALVSRAFATVGVNKIRLTGGEPLVRKDIIRLAEQIGRMDEITDFAITTNGAQLDKFAQPLRDAGLNRINISLDSLNAEKFKRITRTGDLNKVLRGIDAANTVGFDAIKINAVVMTGYNDDEILDLVNFCRHNQLDISFIEEMPLGFIDSHAREVSFCSSDKVRELIEATYSLHASDETTGGPSRYYRMADSPIRIGFISPHSHNFCHLCNRVRVTVEGQLLLCLGNEHAVDLRKILRAYPGELAPLQEALIEAMAIKPEKHHFEVDNTEIVRFMNMTGG